MFKNSIDLEKRHERFIKEVLDSISPGQGAFNGLTYIFAIFGFGAVFAIMTIPNLL